MIEDIKAIIVGAVIVGTFIIGAAYGDACLSGSLLFIIWVMGVCHIITR